MNKFYNFRKIRLNVCRKYKIVLLPRYRGTTLELLKHNVRIERKFNND